MPDIFTDITEILKTEYLPRMESAISEQNLVLNTIKRNSGVHNMSQKQFEIDADAYGANAYAFNPDTDSDLNSHAPTFDSMTVSTKAIAADTFLKDIDLSVKKAGAAADIAIKTKTHLTQGVSRLLNRCAVAPTKGMIARVNGAVSNSTTVVFDAAVVDPFKPNQLITINATDATVSTVDSETQITLTAAVTVSNNDVIYNRTYAQEPDGLGNLVVNTGTVQGVAKGTNFWAHSFLDSDAEALDTADLLKIILKVNRYGSGVEFCLLGEDLWRKVGADLTALKQVNLSSGQGYIDLPGGWSGLRFAAGSKAVPLMAEPDMTYDGSGEIYAVTPDALTLGSLGERFLPGSNGFFNRIDKRPKWEITLVNYCNFAVKNFKGVGALKSKTT